MSRDRFYGVPRTPPSKPSHQATRPSDPRGRAATGHIGSILVGQGHGQIRLADGRTAFFHRADLHEGTAFNTLAIGDAVLFELLDDRISGPRAVRVRRRTR